MWRRRAWQNLKCAVLIHGGMMWGRALEKPVASEEDYLTLVAPLSGEELLQAMPCPNSICYSHSGMHGRLLAQRHAADHTTT